jgi:hypothetical protein
MKKKNLSNYEIDEQIKKLEKLKISNTINSLLTRDGYKIQFNNIYYYFRGYDSPLLKGELINFHNDRYGFLLVNGKTESVRFKDLFKIKENLFNYLEELVDSHIKKNKDIEKKYLIAINQQKQYSEALLKSLDLFKKENA